MGAKKIAVSGVAALVVAAGLASDAAAAPPVRAVADRPAGHDGHDVVPDGLRGLGLVVVRVCGAGGNVARALSWALREAGADVPVCADAG